VFGVRPGESRDIRPRGHPGHRRDLGRVGARPLHQGLGFVLCLQGRFAEAAEQLADAVSLAQRISAGCSAHMLESTAAFAAMTERLELGAERLGAAGRARSETGDKPRPWERAVRNHWLPLISAQLEPPVYVAATERGRARGVPEALDFAETTLRFCGQSTTPPASR